MKTGAVIAKALKFRRGGDGSITLIDSEWSTQILVAPELLAEAQAGLQYDGTLELRFQVKNGSALYWRAPAPEPDGTWRFTLMEHDGPHASGAP